MKDQFQKCFWSCRKCDTRGEMRVWVRPGETDKDSAARQKSWSRSSCVDGCQIMIWPAELKPWELVEAR